MTDPTAPTTPFRFNLDIEGYVCAAEAELPNQAISLTEFLPLVWKLQDALLGIWTQLNESEGNTVSCRAGCGACCRQLVPISEIEALHIKEVIQALPETDRERVLGRFAQAQDRLAEAGILEALGNLTDMSLDQKRQIGFDYFAVKVPCPFLEAESCSIHSVRPSACREYLVSSPPAHCASLNGDSIAMLRHSAKFSSILFSFFDGEGNAKPKIVPLITASIPTDGNPQLSQHYYAPTLFQNFLNRLAVLFSQVT